MKITIRIPAEVRERLNEIPVKAEAAVEDIVRRENARLMEQAVKDHREWAARAYGRWLRRYLDALKSERGGR